MAEKTVAIRKDRKHTIEYSFGQKGNIEYAYVCGPRTNNLWYKIIADHGREVIAKVPDGF